MNGAEILVVEDDTSIATGLALNLKIEGYHPTVIGDGDEALRRLAARGIDLVLLDISLPGASGLEILERMRTSGDQTPVIVLSARRDEFDKVAALRLGADDYVTKPFALAELLARVVAVLRRSAGTDRTMDHEAEQRDVLRFSDVTVNLATRQAMRAGDEVKLTHLEFELLAHFLRNPTRVFAREELLRDVWGLQSASRRTVDNFVAQLRSKLERDPDEPRHLVTVRGSGYRFDP